MEAFHPDLTPEQMKALGVLSGKYDDKDPKESNFFHVDASMKHWDPKWIDKKTAPMGWFEWYQGYASGKRTSDDDRQMRRWASFKARHLAQLRAADPTLSDLSIQPKRRQALLHWGIAPGIDVNKYLEKSAYSEPNSSFISGGKEYNLSTLLKQTEVLPSKNHRIKDLTWVLAYDTPDESRVEKADLSTPVLIANWEGRKVVVDGLHRLTKAVRQGESHILGKHVSDKMMASNLYLEKVASMHQRAKYHDDMERIRNVEERVSSLKYDGGNYFLAYDSAGVPTFTSRRLSVKGEPIEKADRVPHLSKVLPSQAGKVYNVELIHTGHDPYSPENHSRVSGLLNALPERSIREQAVDGPIRAVVFDIVHPKVSTFKEKIEHFKGLQNDFGNKELLFHPNFEYGEDGMERLIAQSKKENREGIITVDLNQDESKNPRIKLVHKKHYNLKVRNIIQERDIHGNLKQSAGALELEDASGNGVGKVGTGFDRATRIDIHENPNAWLNKIIQVKAMKPTVNKKLRQPVYNGDADGDLDTV